MKIEINNYSARHNDIFLIPTISISRANMLKYFDIDFSFLCFMISIRVAKEDDIMTLADLDSQRDDYYNRPKLFERK